MVRNFYLKFNGGIIFYNAQKQHAFYTDLPAISFTSGSVFCMVSEMTPLRHPPLETGIKLPPHQLPNLSDLATV